MYIIYTYIRTNIYIYIIFILREAVISSVRSVSSNIRLSASLSVRTEQLGFGWTDFHEIVVVVCGNKVPTRCNR